MSQATLEAMDRYVRLENSIGSYEAELRFDGAARVRSAISKLLHAKVQDIALFDSGTRAWLSCVNALAPIGAGGRIWTTPYEYAGNLLALQALARRNALRIQVIPLTPTGDLDLEWMARNADSSLRLVSVVHVPSACGIVIPIEAAGSVLRSAAPGALYAVDACQSVGQISIDVGTIKCDLLTAAGRKFLCGPRGTGFAVVSERWRDRLGEHPLDLHCARVTDLLTHELTDPYTARRLETSELNVAALHGMATAIQEATAHNVVTMEVYTKLRACLTRRKQFRVISPGTNHSGIVTVTHETIDSSFFVEGLRTRGINAWRIDGAHTPLYMSARGITSAARFSVHHYSSSTDIARLEEAIDQVECSLLSKSGVSP